jgi:putative ABC transport system permease protein
LKESAQSIVRGKNRTSQFLVVGQVTLSMVLLAGAGLMIQSMLRLGAVPVGFRPDHLLTAHIALRSSDYTSVAQRSAFYDKLTAHLSTLPSVEGIALCSSLPGYEGGNSSELSIAGKAPIENLEAVSKAAVSNDYFRVLGIPLLQGRDFDSRDQNEKQAVAIVNEQMALTYFQNENPIGEQIKLAKTDDKAPWLTIVGVVGDEKRTTVYQEMGYIEPPMVYLPANQAPATTMGLVMRVAGNPMSLSSALRQEVASIERNVPVYDVRTMSARYAEFHAQPRFRAVLMGIFAALTLLLAAIGLYGVLARIVSQRTHEIGIRVALGASRREVLRIVAGHGLRMTLTGLGIGIVAAIGLTRLIETLLFGVKPTDPFTLGAVAFLLCIVALFACYLPARRAMRVDPMIALRHE